MIIWFLAKKSKKEPFFALNTDTFYLEAKNSLFFELARKRSTFF
jgi:hypothetical protein